MRVIGGTIYLIGIILMVLVVTWKIEAKILEECDGVKELTRAKVSRTYMSNWICLMKSVSGMNTRLVTGPGSKSSFSYGVFQINSEKWCARGRVGGICNKRCEDFANDDIQDDIVCAQKIHGTGGFQCWEGWTKKCKSLKPSELPDIGKCKTRSLLEILME